MSGPQLPPGLTYIPEFITGDVESRLLAQIDAGDWDHRLKRRVQHFGYLYDYSSRTLSEAPNPIPAWCNEVLWGFDPEQMIVNEYQPGQGIARHRDIFAFGEPIASLTLGSGCEMVFRLGGQAVPVYLEPRSLVVMRGDARNTWTHEIPARKSDQVNGVRVPRGRRVSVTCRVLKK